MKRLILFAIISIFSQEIHSQSDIPKDNSSWKLNYEKIYGEADVGALLLYSFGASAAVGYQFQPYLGIGVTGSIYSEVNDYFPTSWSGLGIHYRISHQNFIFRYDYMWARSAEKSDDSPNCTTWSLDEEKMNQYMSFSIGFKSGILKAGLTSSIAKLNLMEPCDGGAEIKRESFSPVAFIVTIGISIGNNPTGT